MLRGASILNLDSKGRMAIPTRHRERLLKECKGQLVTTVSGNRDRCLWLYPLKEWEEVELKLVKLPSFNPLHQSLKQMMIGYARDVEMDKNGRILLPATLREFATLDKEIYLAGQGNKFEIWNEKLWNRLGERWTTETVDPERLSPEMEQLAL